MVINTERNILLFQFEHVKWQYSLERAKQKKNKDKEEDREENGFTDVPSRSSTQVYSLKDSVSSKQIVAQESLTSKPHRSRVLLRAAKLPTGKRAEPRQSQGYPTEQVRECQG